jgi:hypothetical protein
VPVLPLTRPLSHRSREHTVPRSRLLLGDFSEERALLGIYYMCVLLFSFLLSMGHVRLTRVRTQNRHIYARR